MAMTRACALSMASEGIYQWNEEYPNVQAFEHDLSREELYVLIPQDEVIGCITISTQKDPEYDSVEWVSPDYNNRYIHRLAVHPRFQGQGNARRLMDFAEALSISQGAISVRLDTFSKNHRNQRFYEARGYRRLENIYFPNQSAFPFYCYEKLLRSTHQ